MFGSVYSVKTNSLYQLYSELKKSDSVVYVEKDYKSTSNDLAKKTDALFGFQDIIDNFLDSPFNDKHLSRQWALKSSPKGMGVLDAYSVNTSSERDKVIVAVVDTGVDHQHKDLPMWTNSKEIPGNNIDDDENGYIDDIHGINTLVRDDSDNATMDTSDKHNHGTHVAGSIAAIQNNEIGIAGVAKNVEIMALRTVPNRDDELDVDVIEAFIYAARNGAKIINCSFGKDENEGGLAVSEAIDYIYKNHGTLVFAAAGNDGENLDRSPQYPAAFENESLIVIASTTSRGSLSYFSNYSSSLVDLAAPGSSIYSTVRRNKYSNMSGTSMASPNAAGVAAEVWSQFPELTGLELKEILMSSVSPVTKYKNKMVSPGLINLEQALELAASK